jgi:hypothetical protein
MIPPFISSGLASLSAYEKSLWEKRLRFRAMLGLLGRTGQPLEVQARLKQPVSPGHPQIAEKGTGCEPQKPDGGLVK